MSFAQQGVGRAKGTGFFAPQTPLRMTDLHNVHLNKLERVMLASTPQLIRNVSNPINISVPSG